MVPTSSCRTACSFGFSPRMLRYTVHTTHMYTCYTPKHLQKDIFRSWTDLVSLLILLLLLLFFFFFFLLGWGLLKSWRLCRFELHRGEICQECFSSKYALIDSWFDDTLSRWWPWRHFTQQPDATLRVNIKHLPAPMQQCSSTFFIQVELINKLETPVIPAIVLPPC